VQPIRGRGISLPDGAGSSRAARLAASFQRLAFILLLVCVAVAPLPYGGVLPGGTVLLEIFAFAIAALAFATRPAALRRWTATPALALIAIAALGALQLVPMRGSTLASLSPASERVYRDANTILHLYRSPAAVERISIAPNATASTILLTLAYAALFVSSAILCTTRERKKILAAVLLAGASIHAVIASAFPDPSGRLHGTFVNPDHMAGYLEIALAFAFGLVWSEVLTNRERARGIRDHGDRLERRALPLLWRTLVWVVIGVGIVLTHSRGGLLAAAVTTAVLLSLAMSRRASTAQHRNGALAAVAVAIGILLIGFITGNAAVLRFLSSDPRDIGSDTRVRIWRSSLEAWRRFPNLGSGLGTFREAFRRVQPPQIVGLVEQAHNDFLQLLVTGGWVGALLGAVAFASLFVILLTRWLNEEHRYESAFILAAFGALLSLTLHGIVEFNMSIPAIPATLAIMCGAACGTMDTARRAPNVLPLVRD